MEFQDEPAKKCYFLTASVAKKRCENSTDTSGLGKIKQKDIFTFAIVRQHCAKECEGEHSKADGGGYIHCQDNMLHVTGKPVSKSRGR